MSIKDKDFIHPFSYFIVNAGVVLTHSLVTERGAVSKGVAAKNLLWFLAWFEREAKANLQEIIDRLSADVVLTQDEKALWTTISDIANELHEKGYFQGAHMKQILTGGEGKEIQQVKY